MASAALINRNVQSTDPSLSVEANRLLTDELRKVVGSDTVDLPMGRADHRSDRHATHSSLVAAAISIRIEVMLFGLIAVMATLIAIGAAIESTWLLGLAFVLMLPTTALVAWSVMRLFDENEHLDPDVAAKLSSEGVGNPDHVFNELLEDFKRPEPVS